MTKRLLLICITILALMTPMTGIAAEREERGRGGEVQQAPQHEYAAPQAQRPAEHEFAAPRPRDRDDAPVFRAPVPGPRFDRDDYRDHHRRFIFRDGVWMVDPYWTPWWWGGYYPYYDYPYQAPQPDPMYDTPPAELNQQYYWYYCANPEGYYPYVKQCPGGWQRVIPTPPSPPKEGK